MKLIIVHHALLFCICKFLGAQISSNLLSSFPLGWNPIAANSKFPFLSSKTLGDTLKPCYSKGGERMGTGCYTTQLFLRNSMTVRQ